MWQHLQRRLLRKPIFREHCPSPVILNGPRLPSPPLRFCHVSTNESLVSTISLLFFTPLVKYLAHTAHTRTGPRHIRGCGTTAKWARRLLAPLGQASEEPPLDATIVKRVTAKRKDAELVAAGSPLGTCSIASSRDPRERVGTQTDSSSMPAVETWRRSRHRLRSARRSSSTGRHASVGMLRTAWTRTCWNRSRASTTLCVFVRGAGRARNPV